MGRPVIGSLSPIHPPIRRSVALYGITKVKSLFPNTFLRRDQCARRSAGRTSSRRNARTISRDRRSLRPKTRGGVVISAAIGELGFPRQSRRHVPHRRRARRRLHAQCEHRRGHDGNYAEVIAQAGCRFSVDPMPGDRSDQPLDSATSMKSPPLSSCRRCRDAVRFHHLRWRSRIPTDYGGKHLLVVVYRAAETISPASMRSSRLQPATITTRGCKCSG